MVLLQSQLLHDTLKLVVTWHPKAHCYMTIFFYKISNYLQKAQILFWQLYTKSPNIILVTIYKSPILFWQLFTKSSNIILAPFSKNPKLLGKQLFYINPNIIWQKNYIMLKAQNYYLAKTFFDCERSRKLPPKKRDFWSAF